MDENETLDYVLSSIINKPQSEPDILMNLVARHMYYKDRPQDFVEIIEILLNDKYITGGTNLNGNVLQSTFKGRRFLKSGGYVKQAKDIASRRFIRALEKWLIVIGTLGAGLYGLFEIWKYFCGC